MVAPHQQVSGDAERYYMPADSVGNVPPDNVIAADKTAQNIDLEKGVEAPYEAPSQHGVDMEYAKGEFEGLRRRYSNMSRTTSRHSQQVNRVWSRRSHREKPVEEDDESQFDVEGVLRGRRKQMDQEEHHPKNIGTVAMGFD